MRYGDRVLEEKERVALFFARQSGEHSRLAPQELCPPPWGIGRGLESGLVVRGMHKDQGSNSLAFFFLLQSFKMATTLGLVASKVADKIGVCAGSQLISLLILMSFSGPFNLASGGFKSLLLS